MNYLNIFESLENDAKRINIDGDWKEYFKAKPFPDHLKQQWLIKRLMELEATTAGATFLIKEKEINELKKLLFDTKKDKDDAERVLSERTTFYEDKLKNQKKDFDYLLGEKDKKIWKLDDYYTGEMGLIERNKKLVRERAIIDKQLEELQKARSAFSSELIKALDEVEHLRDDLNSTILDKNHIQGELNTMGDELGKVLKWLSRPMKTTGTQTDLTASDINDMFEQIIRLNEEVKNRKSGLALLSLSIKEIKNRAVELLSSLTKEKAKSQELEKKVENKEKQIGDLELKTQDQIKKIGEQEEKIKDLTPTETENQLLVYVKDWKDWQDTDLEKIKGELETGKTPFSQWDYSKLRPDYADIRNKLLELVNSRISILEKDREKKELQKELSEKKADIQKLQAELDQAEKDKDKLNNQVIDAEDIIKERDNDIKELKEWNEKKNNELLEKIAKLETSEKEKIETIALMDDRWKGIINIQEYKNLKTLNCSSTQITALPPLPNSLTTLHCQNTQITALPILPTNLSQLYCYNCPKLLNVDIDVSKFLNWNSTNLAISKSSLGLVRNLNSKPNLQIYISEYADWRLWSKWRIDKPELASKLLP